MVPNGWKISTLGEISKVSSGGTPSRGNIAYWGGDIPWVTTAEVKFNTILDTEEKITGLGLEESSAKVYPINTILMAMYGQGKTRGQVAMLGIEATTNQACAAIALNENYDPNYYFQFLLSRYKHIRNLSNSGGRQNLSAEIVKSIQVPIPPLIEQKKIAQILSNWDKAIATTEKLLENSLKQKQALMQQLLTGKKRFSGFVGEWKKVPLGKVAEMNSGGTPKSSVSEFYGGGIPWVSIADMTSKGKWISSTQTTLSKAGLENSSARIHPKNTVLYTMYASIGECSIAKVPLSSSQAILGIRPNEQLHYEYLYFYLTSLKEKIKLQGQQSTQANLNAGMVKEFLITLPQIQEQKAISNVLNIADEQVDLIKNKLINLQNEKKSLMQQLLTGKKRVKLEG